MWKLICFQKNIIIGIQCMCYTVVLQKYKVIFRYVKVNRVTEDIQILSRNKFKKVNQELKGNQYGKNIIEVFK